MPGYYRRPDLTADAIKDGWLYSGDLGYVDEDGFLFLVDRKKDLIISGGVNVYPARYRGGGGPAPGCRTMWRCSGSPTSGGVRLRWRPSCCGPGRR